MNDILVEGKYGHGGLNRFIRPTDWLYHNIIPKGSIPFDWTTVYDVEEELRAKLANPTFTIPVKNQGTSGSCGGQAASYYDEVLNALRTGAFIEKSAAFVYRQTFQPGGGAYGGDLMALIKKEGVSSESLVSSYPGGQPPSETYMETVQIPQSAFVDAVSSETSNYAFMANFTIDDLAQAIRDNHGLVVGLEGQNNGTWLSEFPQAPVSGVWSHWIYFGKVKMMNGKKYIACLNSWGSNVGVNGWQWISEDYINSGFVFIAMVMFMGTPAYSFSKDLYQGMTDADVYFLQKKLNQDPVTMIAPTGPGSPGNETYYFGALTKTAVIKYQAKHGIAPLSGYVGPITRAALNE